MALVNPNIAMGFRQPEFQVPNALAQYAQLQQIQGGQQAQELNALKMQEAQAAMQERNALRQLNPAAADYEAQLFKVNPQLGIAYRKEASTTAAQEATRKKAEFELKDAQFKFLDQVKRNLSKNPSDDNVRAWGQDAVIDGIYTPEQADRTVQELLKLPPQNRAQILAQSGASVAELRPQVVAPGGALVQDGKAVYTAPAAPTQLAKLQSELAALPPGDPRIPQYNALIRKEITPAAGTTVTMVSERAEQGARGKMLVDQYGDISKAAGLAARTLPSIEANLSALNKGFDTGFGKETVAAGASVLAALGVKDAEKFATDTQKFQSNAINGVLQKQLEQKGPQTESDARRIEQIGAQLSKTKDANAFILATAKEQLKRDVEQRNFYDRWYKANKTYDGAEDAWFNGEGGKSLFDRPNLKKYGVSAVPAASAAPAASNRPSLESIFKK